MTNKKELENEKLQITTKNATFLAQYKSHLIASEKAPQTIQAYVESVKAFYKSFDEITKENLVKFKEMEIANHKPATARLRCLALNAYCDFLEMEECKVKNVRIFQEHSVENVPTLQEYYYFLQCLKKDGQMKLYWELRFMANTGARASELVRLEKSHLNSGEATLWTKGKIRKILIPKKLIKESREYFNSVNSKLLFPNPSFGMMNPISIGKQIHVYGERYMLREEILHPHAFRHLFAIQFLDKTNNLSLLSALMGHESIKTTAIYLELSSDQKKKALDEAVDW